MTSREIISQIEQIIIQIATPFCTGTGFYLKKWNIIVTNEHVVRGNRDVVVAGSKFEKQIVPVIYLDTKYDLAFLRSPENHSMPEVSMAAGMKMREGDRVIAAGHPFDLKFTATEGIISSLTHIEDEIHYIQHDAALNPGNSGGPLVDMRGKIIGINTFIIQNGNSIGFSLPVSYLNSTLKAFSLGGDKNGVRCPSCQQITFESEKKHEKHCPVCGAPITMISSIDIYKPYGVCQTVEEMIGKLGFPVALTRKGPNNWSLKRGSAHINISYHDKTGLLIGDVYVCSLPEKNIGPLYKYLLEKNYSFKGLTYSIKNQDIILSLIIQDQFLDAGTMFIQFEMLMNVADEHDNIFVTQFGAKWKLEKS
jgi:serine protease Do